jgi:endonuclease YncB( thermonuclease family)
VVGLLLITDAISAAESPALKAAKTQFFKTLIIESQVLTDQYDRALSKLELELATSADYEEAQLVQKRREELKAIFSQSGSAPIEGILLSPDKAKLSGTAEVSDNTLTGWRSTSSLAEWQNLRIPPGSYFLELEANLSPLAATTTTASRFTPQEKASFSFYEVSLLPGAQENRRSFDIPMNAGEDSFSPVRIGPISFARSPVTLRLVPATGYPANQVQLRNIQLIAAKESSIQAASLPEDRDTLDQAKSRLATELERAQKSALASYVAKLSEIGAASPELKEASVMETKRLQNLQRKDANKPSENLLYRTLARLGNTAGFEDLENARLISDDQLTGDHFRIEHEGKKQLVRLLWVQCAPLESKPKLDNPFAKHFSIDPDDAHAMGRSAREFTLGYLDGKPLRLLLRPNADKDGSRSALVFLSDVGLYQNILVDHGLAAVHAPMKDDLRGTLEKGLISNLLDREADAKKRKSGAWALNEEKP